MRNKEQRTAARARGNTRTGGMRADLAENCQVARIMRGAPGAPMRGAPGAPCMCATT